MSSRSTSAALPGSSPRRARRTRRAGAAVVAVSVLSMLAVGDPAVARTDTATTTIAVSEIPRVSGHDRTLTIDLDDDGHQDRVVAKPGQKIRGARKAGVVRITFGGPESHRIELSLPRPSRGDRFGAAIAAGDFDGDGDLDLAVGVPGFDTRRKTDVGAVAVFEGRPSGLRAAPDVVLTQPRKGDEGPAAGDRFGAGLAAGDFDGNGRDDLAVAAPKDDARRARDAGAVQVLRGTRRGLGRGVDWSSARLGGAATVTKLRLGTVIGASDVDGDGTHDLLVGTRRTVRERARSTKVRYVIHGVAGRGLRAGTVSAVGSGPSNPAVTTGPEWLGHLNEFRSQAGLAPVVEDRTRSRDAARHSTWIVRNNEATHGERVDSIGYTPEGHEAGTHSVVSAFTTTVTDQATIEGWMIAPFHAFHLLDPTLTEVGYGTHSEACGPDDPPRCFGFAATLDIYHGRTAPPATEAHVWPRHGTTTSLFASTNLESPDPKTGPCTSHDGLPVVATFPHDGPRATVVETHFTTGTGTELAHCARDARTYSNPDADLAGLGRAKLAEFNGVYLLPAAPLDNGRYCYEIRTTAGSVDGCFRVER